MRMGEEMKRGESERGTTGELRQALRRGAFVAAWLLLAGASAARAAWGPDDEDRQVRVRIGNVSVAPRDATTATVVFDISWDDSWRHEVNHDAAWVFFKARAEGAAEWQHVRLAADRVLNPTGYGHQVSAAPSVDANAAPACFQENAQPGRTGRAESHPDLFATERAWSGGPRLEFVVPDGADGFTGMFVRRAVNGSGNLEARRVTAVWDLTASTSIKDVAKVAMRAFATKMVYVAKGPFYLGSGGGELNGFYRYTDGSQYTLPYRVTGPGAIPTGRQKGRLWARSSDAFMGLASQPDDGGEIPAAFPNGYEAFYCMRHTLTHAEYADFMNTLTPAQAEKRYHEGMKKSGEAPNVTYLPKSREDGHGGRKADGRAGWRGYSWADGVAWAAWAGLRPMTELEYEKIVRGPREPVPDETGPSYWNVTGWSGCDWFMFHPNNQCERPVTVSNAAGRGFKGSHGRGTVDLPADWPRDDAVGTGFRGGGSYTGRGLQFCRVSDRLYTAKTDPERFNHKWRGVRTAPKEAAIGNR